MNKIIKYGFCFLATGLLVASPAIEDVRDSIIQLLKKNNPTVLMQFNKFYKEFDLSVHSFFDKKNDQSLLDHIKRMEGEIVTLTRVCQDPAFVSVHSILREHCAQVKDLVAIFKQYVGSHNSVAFAWKIKRFEFLLPEDIKKRGHFSIFRSLHHRLMC